MGEWTFVAVYVLLTFPALGAVAFWLHRQQHDEPTGAGLSAVLRESARGDVFELSSGEVDDRFAQIVTQLRADADQRIRQAHERNLSELPGIDGSGQK